MNILMIELDEIFPYKNNPRNNELAVEVVANSIREFGFKNPLILDKNNVIIAGHTRYEAAKQIGLEEIPCVIADDLNEVDAKRLRIADNKTQEKSVWDFEKLEKELDIIGENYNLDDYRFITIEEKEVTEDFEEDWDKDLFEEYGDIYEVYKLIMKPEQADKVNAFLDELRREDSRPEKILIRKLIEQALEEEIINEVL